MTCSDVCFSTAVVSFVFVVVVRSYVFENFGCNGDCWLEFVGEITATENAESSDFFVVLIACNDVELVEIAFSSFVVLLVVRDR